MSRKLKDIGAELFTHKEKIAESLFLAKSGYIEAGKHLMIIKQKGLWRADGDHVISFAHWVENEMGISKASAYQMIEVYDRLGELLTRPEYRVVEYSKAALLLPYIHDDTPLSQKEDLLQLTMHQTQRGLKNNLRELAGKVPTDQCDHSGEQESWNKCKTCGQFWR